MVLDLFRRNRIDKDTPGGTFIQMRQIVKIFSTAAGDFPALKGINVSFDAGEFVSVVGKSGSGKSTLVNMLTGIDHPTSGEVKIGNTYVHKLNENRMARWRGRNLGIVFQFYQLLPMLSLLENTMLPMDFCDMYAPGEREKRALELLDMVGLADVAHKMPAAVSGGQQQSAAIARALANDPPLIIADEPTGNLDSRAANQIFRIFDDLSQQGKTIIMVTHDNSLAERASRRILLADGEVIDQAIASTLSLLTHRQMLKATKNLRMERFAPGETIIRQGEPNNSFYVITKGHTQVIVEQEQALRRCSHRPGVLPGGQEAGTPIAHLGPGQHFGEIELLQKRARAIATIKAAVHSAVEVIALDRSIFAELMSEAHEMRRKLWEIMQKRLEQNAKVLDARTGFGYAQTALA